MVELDARAIARIVHRRVANKHWHAIAIEARRVEIWVDDSDVVVFGEKGLLIGNSRLDVIDAHDMGDICEDTRVRECPILRDRLLL